MRTLGLVSIPRAVASYPAIRTSNMSSKVGSPNTVDDYPHLSQLLLSMPCRHHPRNLMSQFRIPLLSMPRHSVSDHNTMCPSRVTGPLRNAILDPDIFSRSSRQDRCTSKQRSVTQNEQPTGPTGEHKVTEERQKFLIKELRKREAERTDFAENWSSPLNLEVKIGRGPGFTVPHKGKDVQDSVSW